MWHVLWRSPVCYSECLRLLSMFKNENQPQNWCTLPTGKKQDVFFSAFVLSTTQTSKTNKRKKHLNTVQVVVKFWKRFKHHPANQWTVTALSCRLWSCLSSDVLCSVSLSVSRLYSLSLSPPASAVVLSKVWEKRSRRMSYLCVQCSSTHSEIKGKCLNQIMRSYLFCPSRMRCCFWLFTLLFWRC